MRLIDVDKLISGLKNPPLYCYLGGMTTEDILEIVSLQSVVFDIDEIIEKLEKEKGDESDYTNPDGKRLVRHWNLCVDNCKEVIKASVDKEQIK